jgi:hypothetical protein
MRHWLLGTHCGQSTEIFEKREPVLLVLNDATNGRWQLLGATCAGDEAKIGHLYHAIDEDPTLIDVLDLSPRRQRDLDAPRSPLEPSCRRTSVSVIRTAPRAANAQAAPPLSPATWPATTHRHGLIVTAGLGEVADNDVGPNPQSDRGQVSQFMGAEQRSSTNRSGGAIRRPDVFMIRHTHMPRSARFDKRSGR